MGKPTGALLDPGEFQPEGRLPDAAAGRSVVGQADWRAGEAGEFSERVADERGVVAAGGGFLGVCPGAALEGAALEGEALA
ncbi:MAG: hypothetical protein U0935_18525, partial [Pirellulales bacterium]